MCGICGFYSKKSISYDTLIKMNNSMSHRGPDDSGAEITSGRGGYSIGMAHRRLSVMDLSAAGHQPMHSLDGRLTVVFNGEIYNFRELRKELDQYPFSSECDTEVILASYLEWGEDPIGWIKRLDGMFAIALYDKALNKLFLVRDRMGKKPLYYWRKDGNLVFASELKPIMMAEGFPRAINRPILHRYLMQSYINAPYTIFEDVFQVNPGGILSFEMGVAEEKKYWDIYGEYLDGSKYQVRNYGEAKHILKETIVSSVRKRMVADVPVGTFLSGGYDSSLVTAIVRQCSARPVKTFSIGVEDKHLDEAIYARQIAGYLGTDHTEWYFTEKELLELIDTLPKYFDEPMADSSQLPTMLVSKLARQKVTVVLSGDGGDEFFCGYTSYHNAMQAQRYDLAGSILHIIGKIPLGDRDLESRYPIKARVVSQNRDRRYSTQAISKNYIETTRGMLLDGMDYVPPRFDETDIKVRDWQVRKMVLDMKYYLPNDILTKVDRASMKYSLENRCPLLDTEVIRCSFKIPQDFKYNKKRLKFILKDIAHDYLPNDLMERPKQGFSIPINKWLVGVLKNQVADYADIGYLRKQGIFNPIKAHEVIYKYLETGDQGPGTGNNYSHICWNFFVFQQWYDYYMNEIGRCAFAE